MMLDVLLIALNSDKKFFSVSIFSSRWALNKIYPFSFRFSFSKIFDDLSNLNVHSGFKLNTKGVKIYPTAEEVVIEINDDYIQKSAELAIGLYGNIAGPLLNACKALHPAALSIKQFIADTNTLEAEYNQTPESVEKTEV